MTSNKTSDYNQLLELLNSVRDKYLDTSAREPLNNQALSNNSKARPRIRVVHEIPGILLYKLMSGKELGFNPIDKNFNKEKEISKKKQTLEFKTCRIELLKKDKEITERYRLIDEMGPSEEKEDLIYKLDLEVDQIIFKKLYNMDLSQNKNFSPVEIAKIRGIDTNYEIKVDPKNIGKDSSYVDNYIETLLLEEKLNDRLKNFFRQYDSSLNERGTSVVYLTCGNIKYSQSRDSEKFYYAPILLLRLKVSKVIDKGKSDDGKKKRTLDEYEKYKFSIDQERILTNKSFFKKLEKDFDITLKDFDSSKFSEKTSMEDAATYIKNYFNTIKAQIKNKPQMEFFSFCTFDTFDTLKLVQWNDCDWSSWSGELSSLSSLNEILLGKHNREISDQSNYEDIELDSDKTFRMEIPASVIKSDVSQHSALVSALKGENLIIQGPPGTGKSQTIANLIAHLAHAGKKILFMAAKKSALEVVYNKLVEHGLERICTNFEDWRLKKSSFYQRLDDLLELLKRDPDYVGIKEVLDNDKKSLLKSIDLSSDYYDKVVGTKIIDISFLNKEEDEINLIDSISLRNSIYANIESSNDLNFEINKINISKTTFKSANKHFIVIKKLVDYILEQGIDSSKNFLTHELFEVNENLKRENLNLSLNKLKEVLEKSQKDLTKIQLLLGSNDDYNHGNILSLTRLLEHYINGSAVSLNKNLLNIFIDDINNNKDLTNTSISVAKITKKFENSKIFHLNFKKNKNNDHLDTRIKTIKEFYLKKIPIIYKEYSEFDTKTRDLFNIKLKDLDSNLFKNSESLQLIKDFDKICDDFANCFSKYSPSLSDFIYEKKEYYESLSNLLIKYEANKDQFKYLFYEINLDKFEYPSKDKLEKSNLYTYLNDILSMVENRNDYDLTEDLARITDEIHSYIAENKTWLCKVKAFLSIKNFSELRSKVPISNISDNDIEECLLQLVSSLNFISNFHNSLLKNTVNFNAFLTFANFESLSIDFTNSKEHFHKAFRENPKYVLDKILEFQEILELNKKFIKDVKKNFKVKLQSQIYKIFNDMELINKVYINRDVLLLKATEIFAELSKTVTNPLYIERDASFIINKLKNVNEIYDFISSNSSIFSPEAKLADIINQSNEFDKLFQENTNIISFIEDELLKDFLSDESKEMVHLSNSINFLSKNKDAIKKIFDEDSKSLEIFKDFTEDLTIIDNNIKHLKESSGITIHQEKLKRIMSDLDYISTDFLTEMSSRIDELIKFIDSIDFGHLIKIKRILNNHPEIIASYLVNFNTCGEISRYGKEIFTYIYLENKIYDYISENSYILEGERYIENVNKYIKFEDKTSFSFKKSLKQLLKSNFNKMPLGVRTQRIGSKTELGLIQHVAAVTGAHVGVHDFMKRTPISMPLLTPCYIADFSAVSNFMPREFGYFDVVIMDEASQLRIEDAIPTLARGKQFIIAGDSQQLPPTDFFNSRDDSEDELITDAESLLEVAGSTLGYGSSSKELLVHYRSKFSELINFSNNNFYSGKLVVPPSTQTIDKSKCIERVCLRDEGGYRAGGTNMVEVEKIVLYLKDFTDKQSNHEYSILIATMNSVQQSLLNDAIDKLEADSENFKKYRNYWRENESGTQRIRVQNLESIQGDERDIVILSTVYGLEGIGAPRVNQRFGPINSDNGYKRLNVIITRQRLKLKVFTSLLSTDIQDPKNRGLIAFKDFLKYLESGLIPVRAESFNTETESYFEESVKKALELNPAFDKYEKHTQVKQSGFRIDMALYDVEKSEYVIGIECDGAAYHSSRAAKDRDRNRQELLEFKGWKIHRIWSTDWFKDPKSQIDKLEIKLDNL